MVEMMVESRRKGWHRFHQSCACLYGVQSACSIVRAAMLHLSKSCTNFYRLTSAFDTVEYAVPGVEVYVGAVGL